MPLSPFVRWKNLSRSVVIYVLKVLGDADICSGIQLSSVKRSHILCYFTRLLSEVLASVLRIPIRVLACVGLCNAAHLKEFSRLTAGASEVRTLRHSDFYPH